MVMKQKVSYSTYSSNSSRCSMGIVSSNTLMEKEGIVNQPMTSKKANMVQPRRQWRRANTLEEVQGFMSPGTTAVTAEEGTGTSPSFTFRIECQVRLTPCQWRSRLQGHQQCRWQFLRLLCKRKNIAHVNSGKLHVITVYIPHLSVEKGKFSSQKVEKTLHQHLKSMTFYMFYVLFCCNRTVIIWMNKL